VTPSVSDEAHAAANYARNWNWRNWRARSISLFYCTIVLFGIAEFLILVARRSKLNAALSKRSKRSWNRKRSRVFAFRYGRTSTRSQIFFSKFFPPINVSQNSSSREAYEHDANESTFEEARVLFQRVLRRPPFHPLLAPPPLPYRCTLHVNKRWDFLPPFSSLFQHVIFHFSKIDRDSGRDFDLADNTRPSCGIRFPYAFVHLRAALIELSGTPRLNEACPRFFDSALFLLEDETMILQPCETRVARGETRDGVQTPRGKRVVRNMAR